MGLIAFVTNVTPAGKSPNHDLYSRGALTTYTFSGDLNPSFPANGVLE